MTRHAAHKNIMLQFTGPHMACLLPWLKKFIDSYIDSDVTPIHVPSTTAYSEGNTLHRHRHESLYASSRFPKVSAWAGMESIEKTSASIPVRNRPASSVSRARARRIFRSRFKAGLDDAICLAGRAVVSRNVRAGHRTLLHHCMDHERSGLCHGFLSFAGAHFKRLIKQVITLQ